MSGAGRLVEFVVLYGRLRVAGLQQVDGGAPWGVAAGALSSDAPRGRPERQLASLQPRTLVDVLGRRAPGQVRAAGQQSEAGGRRAGPDRDDRGRRGRRARDVALELPRAEVVVLAARRRLVGAGRARRRQRGGHDRRRLAAGAGRVQVAGEREMVVGLVRVASRTRQPAAVSATNSRPPSPAIQRITSMPSLMARSQHSISSRNIASFWLRVLGQNFNRPLITGSEIAVHSTQTKPNSTSEHVYANGSETDG